MELSRRGVQTAVLISVFTFLGTIFVALRLWTRYVIIRAPGYEDTILFLSWLCAVATTVHVGIQVGYGLGEHAKSLSLSQIQSMLLNIYISIITYCASLGLIKIAILVQYQRVFSTRKFQIWCWSFIVIITAYTIATLLSSIFTCIPIRKFWMGGEGTCVNESAAWFSIAIINIVTDLMIIALPMPVISRLKLAKKQKRLLIGVFAFGGVVCIIAIIRLHSLLVVSTSTDQPYDNASTAVFSIVEINVALICACLPALRPLVAKFVPSLSSTSGGHYGSSGVNTTYGRNRSSVLPSGSGYGVKLNSLGTVKGAERLDDEEEDGIRVVTVVDVKVGDKEESVKDGRENSTESLFRNARGGAGCVV